MIILPMPSNPNNSDPPPYWYMSLIPVFWFIFMCVAKYNMVSHEIPDYILVSLVCLLGAVIWPLTIIVGVGMLILMWI